MVEGHQVRLCILGNKILGKLTNLARSQLQVRARNLESSKLEDRRRPNNFEVGKIGILWVVDTCSKSMFHLLELTLGQFPMRRLCQHLHVLWLCQVDWSEVQEEW